MINRKNWYINFIPSLIILVPAPGRFVYGIVLAVEYLLLVIADIFFCKLVEFLKMENLKSVLLMFFSVSLAVFIKIIISLFAPVIALQLGFVMMLPPVSVWGINYFYFEKKSLQRSEMKNLILSTLQFSFFALFFFLFRDVFGYGTFTLFSKNGIDQIVILDPDKISWMTFIATIPGALILSSLIIYFFQFCSDKIHNTAESTAVKRKVENGE